MSSSNQCPFCDETQSFRYVVESSDVRVIFPRNPACAFHVLIVPKRHTQLLNDLTDAEARQMFELMQLVTTTVKKHLGSSFIGFNLLSNNGSELVNQRVPHAHMHVFLRTKDDVGDPLVSRHSAASMEFSDEELANLSTLKTWFRAR